MDRSASAARTGREEMSESRRDHAGMLDVAAGDPDVDIENAYFSRASPLNDPNLARVADTLGFGRQFLPPGVGFLAFLAVAYFIYRSALRADPSTARAGQALQRIGGINRRTSAPCFIARRLD